MNYLINPDISAEKGNLEADHLTGNIIGAAIEVHRALGQVCLNRLMKLVLFMN